MSRGCASGLEHSGGLWVFARGVARGVADGTPLGEISVEQEWLCAVQGSECCWRSKPAAVNGHAAVEPGARARRRAADAVAAAIDTVVDGGFLGVGFLRVGGGGSIGSNIALFHFWEANILSTFDPNRVTCPSEASGCSQATSVFRPDRTTE